MAKSTRSRLSPRDTVGLLRHVPRKDKRLREAVAVYEEILSIMEDNMGLRTSVWTDCFSRLPATSTNRLCETGSRF